MPLALQPPPPVANEQNDQTVYELDKLDIVPVFPEGMSEFFKFLQYNYRIPSNGVEGKAVFSFVIEIDGSLTNFAIISDIGFGTSEEIIKVLKKSPKWKSGILNGQLVRSKYKLFVNVEDGSQVVDVMEPPTRPFNPFGPTKDRNGY